MTRTLGFLFLFLCLVARPAWSQDTHSEMQFPTPSPAQLAWQQAELGVLVCYELHTFNEGRYVQSQERVKPIESIDQFNPTQLDTDQWIRTVKEMGAKFAILTASHESGFRLWQSNVNPYSLKSTKWGNGKRDIVREFIDSCKKYGIRPGIYLGTRWNSYLGVYDFKVTDRSTITQEQYNHMIEKEVKEICSGYGDFFELWFDGGAYGPENGGPDVLSIVETHQKDCLFYHNYDRADARWGGSESGTVAYPCWATFPYRATGSGESTINRHIGEHGFSLLKQGDPEGPYWMPAMSDAPLRNHEWFWEPGDERKIYPLESLLNMYYKSVGRNSTLILGLTPDTRGLIPDADVTRCREFGDAVRDIFRQPVSETSGAGNSVTLDLPDHSSFDHIVIQEDIRMGERVRQFTLESFSHGKWTELNTGTCIGHKRIV
ncbi:MAG: alpha-L-fucosidase, partial [Phycisphaeraceae bacterium]|nr:alpha-L-fucosidase [Phycisphaeraceae bacterium]